MHIFSQILRNQTDVIVSNAFTICDLDSILKTITKNTVTHNETAKSAIMCVYIIFVHLLYKTFLLHAGCNLELHTF
jgi:hypothetical protein